MKKFALAVLVASSAQLALAADVQSLKCERDTRPVDGPYQAVELVKNEAGKYDVFYHMITSGFGSPVGESRVKIAQNLGPCTFASEGDARLVTCYKAEREEGEKTNSGFTTKRVSESQVVDRTGKVRTEHFIDIEVYSPQLMNAQSGQGYPIMERKGRYEDRFSANSPSRALLNRCTVK